jgi:GNAT superfamily N-acetyltransferase
VTTIRPATPADVPAVHDLVVELATYERARDEVVATADDLTAALFAPDPRVHCLVADAAAPGAEAAVVGMALWFVTYSTWLGRHGLWLEDLYVTPGARRSGVGRRLLAALAAECVARGYGRLEWWVLDWNEPAIAFYRSLGAMPMADWTVHRVEGTVLAELAEEAR